jgi:ABC-type antimicrobial peptide transport system permease subunit
LGAIAAPFVAAAAESLLYQPEAWNLASLATAAAVLLAASVAAALAPSLRAARLDPMTALREE